MRRSMVATVFAGLLLAGCSSASSTSAGTSPSGASTNFALEVASTDLYAGAPQRVQVGVFGSTDRASSC